MNEERAQGVVVCSHILRKTAVPSFALRDEPIDAFDSGWQILCDAHHDHWETGGVIRLDTFLTLFPSFQTISHCPVGTIAERRVGDDIWIIQPETAP